MEELPILVRHFILQLKDAFMNFHIAFHRCSIRWECHRALMHSFLVIAAENENSLNELSTQTSILHFGHLCSTL